MQKTENYNLNQWEPSDSIRRSDFNSDNAAIDAAIKAVADTAAGKANAESVNALQQSVNETAAANCMVKLTELTTTAAASYVDVDLSAFDMSQFRCLEVYVENFSSSTANAIVTMQINGDESESYSGSSQTYHQIGGIANGTDGGLLRLTLNSGGGYTVITSTIICAYINGTPQNGFTESHGVYAGGELSAVRFLRFKCRNTYGADSTYNAGFHAMIYGLKG